MDACVKLFEEVFSREFSDPSHSDLRVKFQGQFHIFVQEIETAEQYIYVK